MDEESLRQFRERWQAVAAVEAAEQQSAPIALRWQQLNAVLRLAAGLGLSLERDTEEEVVWRRWAQLKEGRA